MKFASDQELLLALTVTSRWLTEFIRRVETGVRELGLTVVEKSIRNYPDGAVEPVLRLKPRRGVKSDWTFELGLRNALEEFLTIDREEDPVRVDARLLDEAFAESKLASIVEGRLALVRALTESRSPAEFRRKMEELASDFEHIRIWEYEDGGEEEGR